MEVNAKRLEETFEYLGQFGATPGGGITRPALSDMDKQARDTFVGWLKEAGLSVRIDDAGNIYGHRKGEDDTAAPILMASHLDTVYNGGRFDGITGVQSALEVIRTLNDNNIVTKRPIEIAVFTNEEGTRFEPALLGSGIATGVFKKEDVYKTADRDGLLFGEELERIGYMGDEANRPKEIDTYFEMHVEQGPVLDNEGLQIGVLTGIQGMIWLDAEVIGEADHAGPSPMETRKDAMTGAVKIMREVNKIPYELGKGTTTTIGKIHTEPSCINVIPGKVCSSIDVRNEDDAIMYEAIDMIRERAEKICVEEGLSFKLERFWGTDAIAFPKELVDALEGFTKERGYTYKKMASGAGHDASYLSQVAPTAMIFVPSIGGKSHCEEEFTKYEDIVRGANLLLDMVLFRADR